ncbi:GumC family protein [Teichococcus aestuarii]|uniref:GumC family protein n=1 Tax=Teichococcus aestuarii TaxID=568898 RepID=UPI0036147941
MERDGGRRAPAPAEPEQPLDRVALAIEELQQRLSIRTSDNSNVVSVRYLSPSPDEAAQVVNILMERYISLEVAAKRDTTLQANEWLTERLTALREDVEQADRKIQAFRRESGLLETAQGSLGALQLNEQQARVALARQELARAQAALDSVMRSGLRGSASSEALASPVIQSLRDREAEIVQRAATLGQRLGPRHPDRPAAEAELRDLQRQIAGETSRIVTSLRREVDAARDRLQDAQASLATTTTTARSGAQAEVMLAQLTRDAEAKRQVYQAFLTRTEQTRRPPPSSRRRASSRRPPCPSVRTARRPPSWRRSAASSACS